MSATWSGVGECDQESIDKAFLVGDTCLVTTEGLGWEKYLSRHEEEKCKDPRERQRWQDKGTVWKPGRQELGSTTWVEFHGK